MVRTSVLRQAIGGICCLLIGYCLAAAQDSSAPGTPKSSELPPASPSATPSVAPADNIEQVQPALYYLKDRRGQLVAVPGFALEDFEEAYRIKHGLDDTAPQPRYSIQRMTATGVVQGDVEAGQVQYAELTILVEVLARRDKWIRVPLRLEGTMLQQPAEYQGAGEHFLHFEGGGQGYVCWLRGNTGDRHKLTLKMLVPLTTTGNETRLSLVSPPSGWSELKLSVPVTEATARVSEGARLGPPATGNGTTAFSVLWRGGSVELAWREPGQRVAPAAPVLEAVGAVMAKIDRRSVETEATLSVRSHGAEFDRFHVRLPDGARWVPGSASGYTVAEVASDDPAATRRLLEVRLLQKSSGPIKVSLNTTRSHNPAKPDEQIDLAGFEVVEAARQWGHIGIATAGDWQVLFGSNRGVQRVDQLPDPLQREDVVAGFEYFAQPCSLPVRLAARQTRVRVEPEYLLTVDADQVVLEAKLGYTVRGAKAYEMDVVLPGWELDDVYQRLNEEWIAIGDVKVSGSGRYSIPLLQPATGQVELRLRARWPIAEGSDTLILPLPAPQADSPSRSAILVLPADNVELTPNEETTVGLTRQQVTVAMELPQRQQAPLSYRGEADEAVFSAGFAVHRQRISAEVTSRVTVEETGYTVEQDLVYTIAYESADRLIVEVPRELASASLAAGGTANQVEFECDGEKLVPTDLPHDTDAGDSGPVQRMQIELPQPRIGLCELRVRYRRPLERPSGGKRLKFSAALVMPSEGELAGNRLHVTSAAEIEVNGPWVAAQSGAVAPGRPRHLQWTSQRQTSAAELSVTWASHDALGCTVVQRAWVRTWLTPSDREDWAVFSFASSRKQLELMIPAGNAASQTNVWLDGRRVAGKPAADGKLIVPLNGDGARHRYVLDLQVHYPQRRPPRGSISIELPRPADDVWIRQLRWQLILPKDEHLISTPDGFTGEFVWGWDGFGFGRKPLMDEADLEAWAGTTVGERPATNGGNCYLFSNFGRSGDVGRCRLQTSGRAWIVLIASGAALVAGLLLIYVPASRHPATLLVAAVVLMCVGMLYPEPTLLIAQAALLGLALTLLAGLLERSLARPRQGIAPNGLSGSVVESGSTRIPYAMPVADDVGSTQQGPALPPPSHDADQ